MLGKECSVRLVVSPSIEFSPWLSTLTRRKQIVLVAQKLAAVGLAKDDDARGVEAAGLGGAAGGDAEAERRVVHVVDDDALVLGAVVGPPADVGLDDVAAVEEGHLAVALDPYLPAGVLAEDGEGGDVQAKLARLGKLAWDGVSMRPSRIVSSFCPSFFCIKEIGLWCRENVPRQIPSDNRLSRAIDVARLAVERST